VTAIGYADGFRRRLGGIALVNEKRVPILGTVCMDQCILRLDEVQEAKIGDEVVLIGSQGEETISVDELAAIWGNNHYEVVCAMATRCAQSCILNNSKLVGAFR
jgi:alanine racemase